MPRSLSSEYLDQLDEATVKIGFLYDAEFESAPLRLWSGIGDITFDGNTYYGNGWFQGWDGAGETEDVKAVNVTVTLTGVPESVISLALEEVRQNKMGRIWLIFLDDSDAVIDSPYLLFEGKLDMAEISDSSTEATVTFTYETELIDLERAEEWRYSDVIQQSLYPGDNGFKYLSSLADWSGFWGVPEQQVPPKKKHKPKKNGGNRRRKKRR